MLNKMEMADMNKSGSRQVKVEKLLRKEVAADRTYKIKRPYKSWSEQGIICRSSKVN